MTLCSVRVPTLVLALVLLLTVAGWAQDPNTSSAGRVGLPTDAAARNAANESYVAEVLGNDVFIRSGAGTNFYQCGKLYAGDRVQVIKTQQGWSAIVPPPGCFSWISMQYVSINLQNPTMGIVTGDNVGVYTGSDFVEPMHSTSKQVVLNRGQTVKLLGEEKDDYYKIAPPQGAYLWVSSRYLQSSNKAPGTLVADTTVPRPPAAVQRPKDPNGLPGAPLTGLDLYYSLSEQVKAEHAKPLAEQNYTEMKKKLAEVAAVKDGGRATRYAEFTLKQVERYELAAKVAKEAEQQNKELQKITAKINDARKEKLDQIVDRSKFAIMGKLETSSVYAGPTKRFRVLDDAGKTICYVTPTGPVANADLSKYIGHKVGLVGTIQPHPDTSRVIIPFTEVVLLEQ
jgi:uncharacterized protein YgiM (DUF1202 family)